MGAIGLLHLTDFHQGMAGHSALWPLLKHRFYEDLRELHDRAGPWHAIVFTGDLTHKGTKEEFIALDRTLDELRDHLRKLGSDPVLLAVPGNHDLVRPDRELPDVAAAIEKLSHWHELPELRDCVLGKSEAIASRVVHESFANYHDWWLRRCDRLTAVCSVPIRGCMPGDFASSLTVDDLSVAVVGFNTSYLQLHEGVTEGELAIERRQMLALAEDPYRMIKEHDVALLLTHHPRSWLHPRARACFDEEFNPPGIFAAHLFGHMHESYMDERREGGTWARRAIQGRSLFGLEHYEVRGKSIERSHGYSAIRIHKSDKGNRLQIWPRSYEKNTAAAYRRMVPDLVRYDVDANQCVNYNIQSDLVLPNEAPAHAATDSHAVNDSYSPDESSYALPDESLGDANTATRHVHIDHLPPSRGVRRPSVNAWLKRIVAVGTAAAALLIGLLLATKACTSRATTDETRIHSINGKLFANKLPPGFPRSALLYVRGGTRPITNRIASVRVVDPATLEVVWHCRPTIDVQSDLEGAGLLVDAVPPDTIVRVGSCWGAFRAEDGKDWPSDGQPVPLLVSLGHEDGVELGSRYEVLGQPEIEAISNAVTYPVLGTCSVERVFDGHSECLVDRYQSLSFGRAAWMRGGFVYRRESQGSHTENRGQP